jgi:hypothetical protein
VVRKFIAAEVVITLPKTLASALFATLRLMVVRILKAAYEGFFWPAGLSILDFAGWGVCGFVCFLKIYL